MSTTPVTLATARTLKIAPPSSPQSYADCAEVAASYLNSLQLDIAARATDAGIRGARLGLHAECATEPFGAICPASFTVTGSIGSVKKFNNICRTGHGSTPGDALDALLEQHGRQLAIDRASADYERTHEPIPASATREAARQLHPAS